MTKMTPNKLSYLVLGWLVPGLGHYLGGWQRKGIILFVVIAGAFLAGLQLSDWEAVSRDLHEYAFYAEIWVGGLTLPLLYIDPAQRTDPQNPEYSKVLKGDDTTRVYVDVPRHNDTGVLFCAVAGLLNLLALFDLAERLFEPRRRVAAEGAAA